MTAPHTYPVTLGGKTIELPVVKLETAPIRIALADTLGDWQLCDFLAECLLNKAKEEGLDTAAVDVILTAGKAVTLAGALARQMGIPDVAVAEKKAKSFWAGTYQVPSRSITGGEPERFVVGGRRAEMMKGKRILVLDDVISTGESIQALISIADHFGTVSMVMAPFVEGDQEAIVTVVKGYPAVTLCYLPVWPA